MADILKKLGEKAKDVASTLKSLPPGESEYQGIKSAQENVDAMSQPEAKNPATTTESKPTEQDKVEPLARYGSHAGEKRIDTSEMTKPLGSTVPVYDKGGDVSIEASKRLQSSGDSGLQSILNSPDETPSAPQSAQSSGKSQPTLTGQIADYRQRKQDEATARVSAPETGDVEKPTYMPKLGSSEPEVSAPPMPVMSLNRSPSAIADPIADSGGDAPIDVNDGEHQVAILKDGEKVLTPEQADQYRKEHQAEEKGAPADFGGRVLPNPKGLKPILDTDIKDERPTDTDRLPKGVRANTDNAPLKTPEGDISNPLPADIKPEQGREVSTQTLKPYSQVIEDKAKQKAADQVRNPGMQPITSDSTETQVQPKEEVRGTPQERAAIDADKKNAMGKGVNGFVQLGTALIHENSLPTEKENQQLTKLGGETPNQTQPTPEQGGMKPIVNGPEKPQPNGREVFKAKVSQYDSQYQQLMDKAAETGDPQYSEKAERVKAAKEAYLQAHPWGSPESAHPGILGRIGHVAEQVLSRAPVSAPIAATIPGSEGARARESAATQANLKEQAAQNTAENKTVATALPGYHQVTGGAIDPAHPELGPQVAFESEKDPAKIVYQGPITPKSGAGGDKAGFEKTLAKIGSSDVADPTKQRTAIEQAHTDKKITDEEYNNANAYLGATSNAPATQASAAQTKEDQKIAAGFRGKVLVFQNPDGSRQGMTYEQAKSEGRDLNGAMTYTPMAADKLRTAEKSYHNALDMFSSYEKDVNKSKLSTDDERALQVLTSHMDDEAANDYVSKAGSGFLDIMQGEPLTGYSKKAMGGVMTKDQYDKMSPAARNLLADYFQAMLSHFQSIKDTQGSIPRNPEMIRTEMGAIPLPYLNKEEASPAFTKYFERMHNMNVDAVRFGRPQPPKEEATPAAPTGATDEVVKDGKVVGHVVVENGKKVYKALEQ